MTDITNNERRLRSYLRLSLAEGIGPKMFGALVSAFGDVNSVIAAGPGGWKHVKGIGVKTLAALRGVTDAVIDAELTEARKLGVRILCYEDDDFPVSLKPLYDCPPTLYVRGELQPADAVAMAVVGSRRCTHYGMEQAGRFGSLLARAGLTVVSGGARGIDTAAHRGAITGDGRTLAVMGCGLSQTYPSENRKLFDQIVDESRGALISELPMKTAVLGGNFPKRNRIISGLSLGVLVVEAALPSGALITAGQAGEQGKDVFAIPGKVDSPLSAGTHQLLRDGAHLVADLDDILGPLGEVGRKLQPDSSQQSSPILQNLSKTESKIVSVLEEGPLHLDDLARRSGMNVGETAAAMTILALKGAVMQKPGNLFARK